MTTLQNIIDLVESELFDSDNSVFAAEDVEQWTRDAIQDYSMHFPEIAFQTINCSTGDQQYDLAVQLVDIIHVEYPKGKDPKVYLRRRHHLHPDFWTEAGYYDVLMHHNDTSAPELLISSDVSSGEQIEVYHTRHHDHTMLTSAAVTVPDEHHHLLRNYVLWRAAVQLKSAEEANPTSNSSLLMSQLAVNVDRARRAYTDALAKALFATSKSAVISWKDQDQATKRIY